MHFFNANLHLFAWQILRQTRIETDQPAISIIQRAEIGVPIQRADTGTSIQRAEYILIAGWSVSIRVWRRIRRCNLRALYALIFFIKHTI